MMHGERMFPAIGAFVASVLLLVGCTTPEEMRTYNARTCEALGFKPDTPEMRDCMLRLEIEARHRYGGRLR